MYKLLFVAFTLFFLPLCGLQAQDMDKKAQLDALLDALEQYQKMSGSVAILSQGKLAYQKSIGLAEEGVPNTPETRFRIGSITKTFTAVMIFQLIEQNKLKPDDKLHRFFPSLDPDKKITILHLLRHQSGLGNFTDAPEYPSYMTEAQSRQQILERIRKAGTDFEPGSTKAYSNSNYYLLGQIIEEVSGRSYAKQLQKAIAKPLKLKNTYFGGKIKPEDQEAHSYFPTSEGGWQQAPQTDMSIPHGAGAIVSNPSDLLHFIEALFEGRLLKPASLEMMKEMESGMGAGIMVFPFYEHKAYGHNGGIDGFQSNLAYFPDSKTATVILANGLNYTLNDVLIGVLSYWFERPYTLPDFSRKAVEVSEETLKTYVGMYSSEQFPLQIRVFLAEGKLMGQATGQGPFPLTPYSPTEFVFEPAGIEMNFENQTQFTFKQGGRSFLFERTEE